MKLRRAMFAFFWLLCIVFAAVTVLRVRHGNFGALEWWGTINAVAVIVVFFLATQPAMRIRLYAVWFCLMIATYIPFVYLLWLA